MLVGEAYRSEPESSLPGLSLGRLRVRCTIGSALFGRTAAVLLDFHWLLLWWFNGWLSRSSNGADGGRDDLFGIVDVLIFTWLLLLSLEADVDERRLLPLPSDWLLSRQIFNPAQKRSNESNPLAGVTRRRLSITPGGRPLDPSSCHRCSMSDSRTNPLRLSSIISNRVRILLTNRFGRLSRVPPTLLPFDEGGVDDCNFWWPIIRCDCCWTLPITTPVLLLSGTLFRFIVYSWALLRSIAFAVFCLVI